MPDNKATQSRNVRRICIFASPNTHGAVDDYVTYFLTELGKHVERILFYTAEPLSQVSTGTLRGVAPEVTVVTHQGDDALAYKDGLERIAFNHNGEYDEVLMVNDACYGPIYPFVELFGAMEARQCDFWGVTAKMETPFDAITGIGPLPYRLSTNFIAVRSKMACSPNFLKYWAALPVDGTAVTGHEARFTEYFSKAGFKSDTYLDCRKYGTYYPALFDVDEMMVDRSPLLERRSFLDDPRFLEYLAADLPRALQIMAKTSTYDPALIWRNVVRSAELRTLNTNAALTSILPDVRIKSGPLPEYGRIAVCAHVYYTDMIEELLSITANIPCSYDFIATTDSPAKKEFIEKTVNGRAGVGNVIVRVVEQNRGRDMSSLFITCRDLFIGDRYDLVCRLHTKKSPQVAAGVGNMFKRHMFENLLNSPGYTTNVLDMFRDQPWTGVAVPPLVHIAFPTMGNTWFNNRSTAEHLKVALGLNVNFDTDTSVGAFGTMFWFRPKALHKLFAYPWQWSDFNAEPHHVDGSLAHVLERMICYVAQDAGYTTQQILNPQLAARNFVMLEYKLQKFSATLPNSDFTGQFYFLDHWRRLGYPTSVPTATIRSAFGDLLQSMQRSVAFRFPKASKLFHLTR